LSNMASTTAPTSAPVNKFRKRVLSDSDLKFWNDNGYIVVRNAISTQSAQQMIKEMWEFLKMDPKDIDKCYKQPLAPIGFVELYHSKTMWENRTNERVYNAFADLWGRDDLWVSLDRCGIKLPVSEKHPDYHHRGFIHWDCDVSNNGVVPLQLQAAIALSDTTTDMGGFHCCPGMHKYLGSWLKERKVDIPKQSIDMFYQRGFPVKVPRPETTLKGIKRAVVPMNAGDMVIWRGELAHGNGENISQSIRYAQYITMFPAIYSDRSEWSSRLTCFKNKAVGGQNPYPQLRGLNLSDPKLSGRGEKYDRKITASVGKDAELSELGRLLLGQDQWPSQADDEQQTPAAESTTDNAQASAGSDPSTTEDRGDAKNNCTA